MRRKKIAHEPKMPVKLTLQERNLIRDETSCDPGYVKVTIVDGKDIVVYLSPDDIEDIQGCIAAEANHTKNKKLQRELDRLLDKLQAYLDSDDGQDKKREMIPFLPAESFTKEAKERWSRIPKLAQDQILKNVFCGKCIGASAIVLESAVMERNDLILRGRCKICGQEVCRLVEPDR